MSQVLRSDDGRVRKVKVNDVRDGERKTYLGPTKQLVLLLTDTADPDQQ